MQRHALVRSLLQHYGEAASVSRGLRVFTRPGNIERVCELSQNERRHLLKGYALTAFHPGRPDYVYVNVANHATLRDLIDTAAHETVHRRWPSMCHGELFAKRVRALVAGGRVGPKGSRLPDAFR